MLVFVRGGGDLASGVALRLKHAGLSPVIAELPQPLVVRRRVAFAAAVYEGSVVVEGVRARRVDDLAAVPALLRQGEVPVLVDPQAAGLRHLPELLGIPSIRVLVDGRMTKRPPELPLESASLVIGLGPGFLAGVNCHAVVETNRGHCLGRVIWQGGPEADTGIPESVVARSSERVLRAPADGPLEAFAEIGDRLEPGQQVAAVAGQPIVAPFRGVLRGLVYPGLTVTRGAKVGDLDPRNDPLYSRLVSDKSLAIGGGVLEAILSRPDLRPFLWE